LQRGALETAQQYSWNGVAERTIKLYDSLLAVPAGRLGSAD
jgi:hypothetical protein